MSTKSIKKKLEELKKAMRNAGIGGLGSVKSGASLPNINTLTPKPGNNSLAGKTGIPGIKQPSKVNPINSAEQTQNKDIKDMKMKEAQAAMGKKSPQMVKFEKNGQWSIVKADSVANMGYDDAPDSVIAGATVNQVADRGSDVNVASVDRPGASVEKSGYKGYNEADNAKRKANNLTIDTDVKAMPRVKEYGGSGPSAASRDAAASKRASAKNEVKWTHKHPETGETTTVSMTPRKLKNYQIKMKALVNEKASKSKR